MVYSILLTAIGISISADSAAEAVRKSKALFALGRLNRITGHNGEPLELRSLELAVRERRLA